MLTFPQDPMLARPVKVMPSPTALRGGCVYEPKFDGYRALLFIAEDGCRVQSRRGHDITAAFPDVARAAEETLPAGVVLDGELVVWVDGAMDFSQLQRRVAGRSHVVSRRPPASFAAFDGLAAEGRDLRSYPLTVRRSALEVLLSEGVPPIQAVPQTADLDEADEWLSQYAAQPIGIEGIVIKGAGSRYLPGRREWLKLRIRDTVETVVAGVIGAVSAPERLLLAVYDEAGELAFAGTTKELTPEQRAQLDGLLEEHAPSDPHPWTTETPRRGVGPRGGEDREGLVLVRPSLVVEISTDIAMDGHRRRHVIDFVRARPDLSPVEIRP
jgi:ATP-dependent DNA ligase